MIEVNKNADHGILALKVSGTVTEEELDDLVPSLETHITSSDDPHLLMMIEDFNGWEDVAAILKELQMDAEYIGYFDRIAIVGKEKWQKWGTKLLDSMSSEELKFFPIDRTRDAWKWIEQNHN